MARFKLKMYPLDGGDGGAREELHRLPEGVQGEVNEAITNMVLGRGQPPFECPMLVAVRCFTVRTESRRVHVLWSRLPSARLFLVLYIVEGQGDCPPWPAYEVARARLNHVPA